MCKFLFVCCLLFCLPPCYAEKAERPQELRLFSRETLSPLQFELSDNDWRWLGVKRDIKVAVYAPDNPPFNLVPEPGTFEGLSADYILMVSRYLGLRTQILRYSTRAEALMGLQKGDTDILVDDAAQPNTKESGLLNSIPFIPDQPALVSRDAILSRTAKTAPGLRIALQTDYLSDEWVTHHYPGAQITRYPSSQKALSSVAFGENDYFIGNLAVTSFLIERNYANILSVADVFSPRDIGPHFIFREKDVVLQRGVDAVLRAIPAVQHKVIFHQWSQGSDLWQYQSQLQLTEREKRWLAQHHDLRVVFNPLYAPFTMFSNNEKFQGISADILRLIHLRTGLNFKAVESHSVADMFDMVDQGEGDFIAAMSFSEARDKKLLFTRPYITPPFVLVVRAGITAPQSIESVHTLAITPGNMLRSWLETHYPDIKLIEVENASVALHLVNEGQAEGAVNNLISANYMIERYFRGKLSVSSHLGDEPARISFAVKRNAPELYSILNKALADIPPRDMSTIVNKWKGAPDVRIDTWLVYRSQFYWLVGVFAILVLTSLVWNYCLRREIRMRKDAQKIMQEQATFRETLFNGTPVPVYVVDRNGHILNHNQAWDTFFQQQMDSQSRLPLTSREHPLAEIYPTLQQMLQAPEKLIQHPERYTINNGIEDRVIIHQAVPFNDLLGKTAGLICSWQDITEHEYLMEALTTARERAEQANRTKSTFLATMSHEIRTPISAIIGLLELAVTNKNSAKADSDSIRVAYESAQSLMGLIGDILDMAKIESGKLELSPEWVPVSEIAAPVVRVFNGLARQKGLVLNCHVDILHPDEILIDPMRLRQVLSNLISNAIKFTPQGSVDVHVSCFPNPAQQVILVLVVTDTGIGIDQEDQERLFTPYAQSMAGKKQNGAGLGLSICQQLVNMMGGTITLHSQPQRGTRITVQIPVSHRHHIPERLETRCEEINSIQPLNILTVDDHPANRLLLTRQLSRLGHYVIEAENGAKALQVWRENDVDLVITDCSMPIMDGFMLSRLIRKEQTRPLTILGLTANAQPEERARCLEAGMDDCLFKPLRLPQLEVLLRKVPRRSHAQTEKAASLERLVDLPALYQLAQNDTALLKTLLCTTRDENQRDLQQAQQLAGVEDWLALARCLHRLAGAAQIIGAVDAEESCRALELYCAAEPEAAQVKEQLEQVIIDVTQLNIAIDAFLVIDA